MPNMTSHEMESSLDGAMSSTLLSIAEPVRFVCSTRDMPAALVDVLREKLTISRYDSPYWRALPQF